MFSVRRSSLITLRLAVTLLFLCGLVRATLFTVYRVAGSSMLDALADGDRIVVIDAPWTVGVGDTIVLEIDGEVLVKRIVGGPGDRIAMFAGHVIRNGRVVRETIPTSYSRNDYLSEYTMAPDEYFVLGDHRRVSVDSRDFGPVGEDQLRGRVLLRVSDEGIGPVRDILPH